MAKEANGFSPHKWYSILESTLYYLPDGLYLYPEKNKDCWIWETESSNSHRSKQQVHINSYIAQFLLQDSRVLPES